MYISVQFTRAYETYLSYSKKNKVKPFPLDRRISFKINKKTYTDNLF